MSKYQKISIASMILVFSGVFGWLYEFVFYYFNGGMKMWYMQGGNFLPWINIYVIGAFVVLFLTRKIRNKPLLVFLISTIATGIVEYIGGWFCLKFLNARFWNYNVEIWNFGNINGFICLRSILFFGISSMLLIYLVLPIFKKIVNKYNTKKFMIICLVIASIFIIDEIYNLIFTKLFDLPSATKIYKSLGLHYVE
ncbi:MAG: putative ABC transporter permease [Bacilli bacterium]|nr:putative ABC transporter permease [Bacilli bacterium]MBO6194911.1 putative ABC transporter permease [Bacilli bacterium]